MNSLILRACLKTRPVRAPGLQGVGFPAKPCRPRALTRRPAGVFKHALMAPSLIFAGLLAVMTLGCTSVTGGRSIKPSAIAFVTSGSATGREVIENLGPPLLELAGGHLLVYSWETSSHLRVTFHTLGRETGEAGPKPKQWAFCVATDRFDRVLRHHTITAAENESVQNAALTWYRELGPPTAQAHRGGPPLFR